MEDDSSRDGAFEGDLFFLYVSTAFETATTRTAAAIIQTEIPMFTTPTSAAANVRKTRLRIRQNLARFLNISESDFGRKSPENAKTMKKAYNPHVSMTPSRMESMGIFEKNPELIVDGSPEAYLKVTVIATRPRAKSPLTSSLLISVSDMAKSIDSRLVSMI